MISTSITCDCCGAVKGLTNHWWEFFISNGCLSVQRLTIYDARPDGAEVIYHLCGAACVIKKVSEFLAGIP